VTSPKRATLIAPGKLQQLRVSEADTNKADPIPLESVLISRTRRIHA
jgi:hypothetical protein